MPDQLISIAEVALFILRELVAKNTQKLRNVYIFDSLLIFIYIGIQVA